MDNIRNYILESNCRQCGNIVLEGRPQTPETRKKISIALKGKNNPLYKDGRRSYRDKVHAKPGEIVHHKNGKRTDNSLSNLKRVDHSTHNISHHREKNFH